jgi:drug/metabolite transporter (DMT)-like permease
LARLKTRWLSQDVQALSQQVMAFLIVLPAATAIETPLTLSRLPLTWLGVLGTAIAYVLYFSLIHSVGSTRTMLVTYVFPLVGVVLGVVFLGELLIWQELVGGLLIISGIVIVNSRLQLRYLPKQNSSV